MTPKHEVQEETEVLRDKTEIDALSHELAADLTETLFAHIDFRDPIAAKRKMGQFCEWIRQNRTQEESTQGNVA